MEEEDFVFDSADDELLAAILDQYDKVKKTRRTEEERQEDEAEEKRFDAAIEDISSSVTGISEDDDDDAVSHPSISSLKKVKERKMQFEDEHTTPDSLKVELREEEEEELFSPMLVRSSILIKRLEKCMKEKRNRQIKVADLEIENTALTNKCKIWKKHASDVKTNFIIQLSCILLVTVICIHKF